jgi:hypothetical protein
VLQIAEDLWVLRYPLSLLGTQVGRTVTLIRQRSGHLIIHSTAPFTPSEVKAIRALGPPAWLLDATLFHDTFAAVGRTAFPEIPYAAPKGFPGVNVRPLTELAQACAGELEVLRIDGMPRVREHVFFHRSSRTLVVADLVFNFGPSATPWTRAFFRWAGGVRQFPGVTRLFRACIRDRSAFQSSIARMMEWNFDRVIVGHGDVLETNAKITLARVLA